MGIDILNCKCNCNENQGASFIFDEISDDYLPKKRRKNSLNKNVDNFLCNSCKKDLENKQEINTSQNTSKKIIPINTSTYEHSRNLYFKKITMQSYSNTYTKKDKTINNINIIYNQNYILNTFEDQLNDDLNINLSYLILLQAVIRGWLFRQKYVLYIKSELIKEENELIKNSIEAFSNKNIEESEKLFGCFDKNSWKTFYNIGEYLFPKNSKEKIFEKYNLKKPINNFYNFGYRPKTNPDFLIDNLDDDKDNEEQLYEILETVFHQPSKDLTKKTYPCKLKLSSLIQETMYIGSVNIEGERQGYGTLIQKNGIKIEGYWTEGTLKGWGRVTDGSGQFYEGYFINGKINGKGKKKNLEGSSYIGEFFLGMKEGFGKEENKKIIYEGEFHKNLKCGKGACFFKLLEENYEGEFDKNVINGYGFYKWKNGNTFKGYFINGKMNGVGLFLWTDGSKYYGNYKDNIKEGKGKFTWPNGKCFEGNFLNGKPNGKGTLTLLDDNGNIISSDIVEYDNGKLKK
jgi:hypothetical protein